MNADQFCCNAHRANIAPGLLHLHKLNVRHQGQQSRLRNTAVCLPSTSPQPVKMKNIGFHTCAKIVKLLSGKAYGRCSFDKLPGYDRF